MINPEQRDQLRSWFQKNMRIAPWRVSQPGKRDPYATWVAETMLQQTTFSVVIPFFENWMRRFPGIKELAASSESLVLQHWAGLGYYSRAKNLHKAAQSRVQSGQISLPASQEELQKIKGIGTYTSGAIRALAFNKPAYIVDGNIARVLSRFHLIESNYQKETKSSGTYKALSLAWLSGSNPGVLAEALIELGATLCKKKQPLCSQCPIAEHCKAYQQGKTAKYPATLQRPPSIKISGALFLIRKGQTILLCQGSSRFLPHQWGYPLAIHAPYDHFSYGIKKDLFKNAGSLERELSKKNLTALGKIHHRITKWDMELNVYVLNVSILFKGKNLLDQQGDLANQINWKWAFVEDLNKNLIGNLWRKATKLIFKEGNDSNEN